MKLAGDLGCFLGCVDMFYVSILCLVSQSDDFVCCPSRSPKNSKDAASHLNKRRKFLGTKPFGSCLF